MSRDRRPVVQHDFDFTHRDATNKSIEGAIEIDDRALHKVFDGSTFNVPEYQRLYRWKESHWRDFWKEIERVVDLPSIPSEVSTLTDLLGVYFGAIYLAEREGDDRLEVVDGQQRLSTVSLFAYALLHQFEDLEEDGIMFGDAADDVEGTRNVLEDLLYKSKFEGQEPRVQLNKHDAEFFRAFLLDDDEKSEYLRQRLAEDTELDGRYSETKTLEQVIDELQRPTLKTEFTDGELEEYIYFGDSHEKLVAAYEFFREKLATLIEDQATTKSGAIVGDEAGYLLVNVSRYLFQTFVVDECRIELESPKLRMNIFESLNDKGLELGKTDLIRARIVNQLVGDTDEDAYIEKWEDTNEAFGGNNRQIETFLGYFVAATENVDTVSDANSHLMDVFSVETDESVRARLETPADTKELIDEISDFARYYKDITNSELKRSSSNFSAVEKECTAILSRLKRLGTTQWRPLGTYVYMQVDKAAGRQKFFRDTLRAIENLTFRQSISDYGGESIEGVYVRAVSEFRSKVEDDEIDPEDVFDIDVLVQRIRDEANNQTQQLFGSGMIRSLVQHTNWTNDRVRCLFWKMADAYQRDRPGLGTFDIDYDNIHVEHILPQEPVKPGATNPLAWLKTFFKVDAPAVDGGETGMSVVVERLETEYGIDSIKIDEEDDPEALQRYKNEIKTRFINDFANMIFLRGDLDSSIQNSLFARKMKAYLEDDFSQISVNRFFTSDGDDEGVGIVDGESLLVPADLEELADTSINSTVDQTDNTAVSDIERRFNQYWTYEELFRRKEALVSDILDSLTFRVDEDEFDGLEATIAEEVQQDMERRIQRRNF
jgi:uncharacterized protein with ParB-like and HNH nuclease domain